MEVLKMAIALHALCLHQGTGGSPHTASISEDCSGTLLALHNSRWVTVTLTPERNNTKKDMTQLCKDLDCGGHFAENGTLSMKICPPDCTIINSNLYNCTEAVPDNCSNVVDVICAWQAVQLVGGSDRCAGRVELFGTEGWGSVCDDGWDLQAGNVVCAQLGCGTAVRVLGEAGDFEAGSGPIHISELNCSGTERSLWQCDTETDKGKNYCGHKEDASVVCSGSSYIPVTTLNTFMPDVTNWTTETVTEIVAEDTSGWVSPPVLGCIVLSVTLLLLLLSNAAQCAYYKKQNGGPEARRASQALQQDNSDTSSDSDYEHYQNPDPRPLTTVNDFEYNFDDCIRVTDSNQVQRRFCEERNSVPTHTPDSESRQQMTPLNNISEAAKHDSADLFDSDSTSSGESYENTVVGPCFQTLERDPVLPEQHPVCHPIPQLAENSSVSQPYCPEQAHALDSESTSSEECYENLLNTVEEEPVLPEQHFVCHPIPQLEENSSISQPYCPEQEKMPRMCKAISGANDDNSTSSEDPYENVADEDYVARSKRSVSSSSSSDYDDVGNW